LIHITTPLTSPKETFIVPYQKNDQFTGRRAFLAELSTKLWEEDSEKSSHRVILHGLGGVGKTQIALQYAHTHRDNYGNVFWVNAVSDAMLLTGFQEIAKRSGCINDIGTLEPMEIATRVLSWLNAQSQWLLIIDNLEEDCVVEKYLPHPSPFKHTIITTRNQHCDIPAEKLEVGVLDLDDSTDLLLTRSKIAPTTDVHNEATKIVSLLGYLPLAIEQAAAYIREISKNIFNFIKRYTTARILFDKKPQKGIRYYSESVATTWRLSFEKCNSDTSNLLRLLAFLNPDGILIEFLEAGISGVDEKLQQILPDSERFDLALSELERFSLIKRQGDDKNSKIVIHRLVQAVIKDEMPSDVFLYMTEAIMKLCDSAFPHWNTSASMDNEIRLKCRKFQNQILTPLSDIPSINSAVIGNLSYRFGMFLDQDGKYRESEELLTKAISVFEEVVGSDHRDTFRAKSGLGLIFVNQGLSAKAISLLEPLLEVATRLLGDEDLDVLEMKRRLAWAYQDLNRMEDAVKLGKEVLEARTRLLGEEYPDTLRIMSNLAWMYYVQGNLGDAVKLEEEVLEARTRLLGKEHPDTLTAMSNLAITYGDQGNWEKAGKLEERVLEARTRLLGKEHPDTLTAMSNLAITYGDQGNWEKAGKLQERVLEARTRLLGKEHPDTLTAMRNLAITYSYLGKCE
jgi:tetratricopeptide (TPR) repeat protein